VAHESELWPVASGLRADEAIFIEPMSVALHAVLRRPPAAAERALVVGAGTIGLLTIQMAKFVAPGAKVTALARYPHQAERARAMGADEVLEGGDLYGELARISGAARYDAPLNRGMLLGGFEVVYDCVGSAGTLTDSLRWARAGGAVVMVGVTLEQVKLDLNPIWYQEVDLIGSHTFGVETWEGERRHTFDLVVEGMLRGELTPAGLITHRFPFEEHRRAIATALDKRTGSIKVVFEYEGS
jgi:threonine dehydrogenase-like Zn-dependent dehydrogenase